MGTSPMREQSKTRKPYTITKQRQKWTDEEHNRFLESLRLHGRAWQRIQEHIGTKSAVQIRSHAQKFFLKLEKGSGGMPSEYSHDIEIPPPRPKRKPHSSYPRKIIPASQNSSEEAREKNLSKSFVLLTANKVAMDAKMKTSGEGFPSASNYFHNNDISERSQEHIPMMDVLKEKRIRLTKELKKHDAELQIFGMNGAYTEPHHGPTLSKGNMESGQIHETIVAQVEGTKYSADRISASLLAQRLEANADLNLSLDSTLKPKTSAATSSSHLSPPSISLITQLQNDENAFNSLISLTNYFPYLLESALTQNPVVHHAANVAAAVLPPTYADFFTQPNTKFVGEAPEIRSFFASSGISAIVTATVAAACAWWRFHGLFPSPFNGNNELLQTLQASRVHDDYDQNSELNANQNHVQKSATQTLPRSALLEPFSSPNSCANQAPDKKKHDPSSCDSNTSPSSEVEKDATLNKEEANRFNGSSRELGDAWNSKSMNNGIEEGPIPFHALFSQEMPPNVAFDSVQGDAFGLQIDLNRKVLTASTCNISKEIARNESRVATEQRHLAKTEGANNVNQGESSRNGACL